MSSKYQYFNGLKFTRDDKTGYYLNSTIEKRMHRYVWEFYNGPIPKGYDIHHKDEDKANNDISNLEMIKAGKHQSMHSQKWHDEHPGEGRKNFAKAVEAAKDWHKSKEGKEWHSKHAMETFSGKRTLICEMCGKEYETQYHGNNKFCSNACRSKWRRKSGLDNVTRACVICGKEFLTNKFKKVRYCSRSCANKAMWRSRRAPE